MIVFSCNQILLTALYSLLHATCTGSTCTVTCVITAEKQQGGFVFNCLFVLRQHKNRGAIKMLTTWWKSESTSDFIPISSSVLGELFVYQKKKSMYSVLQRSEPHLRHKWMGKWSMWKYDVHIYTIRHLMQSGTGGKARKWHRPYIKQNSFSPTGNNIAYIHLP